MQESTPPQTHMEDPRWNDSQTGLQEYGDDGDDEDEDGGDD